MILIGTCILKAVKSTLIVKIAYAQIMVKVAMSVVKVKFKLTYGSLWARTQLFASIWKKGLTGAPMLWASRVTYMTWTLMWERQYCYLQLVERRKHNYAALVMHLKDFNKGHLRRYNCQVTTTTKVCGLIIIAICNNIHQIKVTGYRRPESNFYLFNTGHPCHGQQVLLSVPNLSSYLYMPLAYLLSDN